MSISRFYTQTFTQYRQVYTANKSVETLVGTLTGHIQQTVAELAQELGMQMALTYSIWLPTGTDIKTGDTLVIGSNRYSIKAVQDNNFVGANKHFECIAEKKL